MARLFLLWKLTGAKFNFESMFQQERNLCIVCKGYIENKNERTLFTYSFVIDTIKLQDDLYKRRFFYVLYVNDYI